MDNLIFSLNATMPVFFLMVLGYILRQIGWIDEDFAQKMNGFVFKLALPVLLFRQLATTDFISNWDGTFVLFCFIVTILSILICFGISQFLEKEIRGEFIQASYRSSAALLGIAFITNIYNDASMTPLMIIGAVPLYNMMAVIILSLSNKQLTKDVFIKTIKDIITNPIILGILLGIIYSLLHIPMPTMVNTFLSNISSLATPLGLISMGACLNLKTNLSQLKNAALATFIKLIGLNILFLPIAIYMGYTTQKLIAILIMLGSATTVSSYVMARLMGHKGILTSNVVMLTTLFSGFTLTFWIYLLKTLNLL